MLSPSNADTEEAEAARQDLKILDASWHNYVNGGDNEKREPSTEVLHWVQEKYMRLGVHKVIVGMLSHSSPLVRLMAFRLGIGCLDKRNSEVQAAILTELKTTRNSGFFRAIYMSLNGCATAMRKATGDKATNLMNSKTKNAAQTKRMLDIIEMQQECCSVLVFLSMCVYQNISFSDYIREQDGNAEKHNILEAVEGLFDAIKETLSVSFYEWTSGMLSLAQKTMAFICAATEGPCTGNQEFFLRPPQAFLRSVNGLFIGCNELEACRMTVTLDNLREVSVIKTSAYCTLKVCFLA